MATESLFLLFLIIIANGAPVLIRLLLQNNLDCAVDFGVNFLDKNRIFGSSKTWRGIAAALLMTAFAASLIGYPPQTGLQVAVCAILGDLLSSFIKRRLELPPSSNVLLLDQIPESLLPALLMQQHFNLELLDIFLVIIIFTIIDFSVTYMLYHWKILKKKS